MIPALDMTEALLATVGVRQFIYRDFRMVTKDDIEKMARLPETIQKLARALCRGELSGVGLSAPAYKKTRDLLFEDYGPDDLEAASNALAKNAAELDAAVLAKVADVIAFLRTAFPRATYETLEGQELLEPCDYDLFAFTAILDAIDNPLTVFDGMSDSSVLGPQIAAVHLVYPTLSKLIDEAVVEMPAELRAAKASFALAWNTEIGINKWLGNPPVDADLVKLMRDAEAANAPAPAPAPKASRKGTGDVKAALSDADRASYGGAK